MCSLRWFCCVIAGLLGLCGGSVTPSRAQGESEEAALIPRSTRIAGIFRPFQTDRASLSPDGRHVAYEERREERLHLIILNLDSRQAIELPLAEDRATALSGVREKVPMRITYLGWPTAGRLVAVVQDEVLVAVNADGTKFRQLVDWKDLQMVTAPARERAAGLKPGPRIIGFDVSTAGGGDSFRNNKDAARDALFADQLTQDPLTGAPINDPVTGAPLRADSDLDGVGSVDLFGSGGQAGPVPETRPVVLDLLPADPDHILVEARGRAGPTDDSATLTGEPAVNAVDIISAVFRVNIHTGRPKGGTEEIATSRLLVDRQGHARVALAHFGTDRNYRVAPEPGARWVPLDRFLGESHRLSFQIKSGDIFAPRSVPLGFGQDPNLLFFASNVGRDTFGIYALDLKAKHPTELAIEHDAFDLIDVSDLAPEDVLIYDRHRGRVVGARLEGVRRAAIWVDRELAAVEANLRTGSPEMDFELLEWDDKRQRFLLLASSQSRAGGYYLYDRAKGQLIEIASRAPWIEPATTSATTTFVVRGADGQTLTGYFTYPNDLRLEPVPLLVYCHDGPWSRDRPGFDRGAQALASMGFAVLQVNYRGSSGFGRRHLEAMREGVDKLAIEDIMTALDWVQTRHAVSQKRVAVLGNGFGGYLALRAVQLHPDRFRCAVSINAPTDLPRWLNEPETAISFLREMRRSFFWADGAALVAASPVTHAAALRQPVLIVQAYRDAVVPEQHARALRLAMRSNTLAPEYLDLPAEGHARWLPGTYVQVFERLEEFFKTHIFDFTAEIGETRPVD